MTLSAKIRSLFNPSMYHGWGNSRKYFEGWYFKVVNAPETKAFAFIPGISMNESGEKLAFIQVLDGRGYIEKDWGHSFPSAYTWMQSNHFNTQGTSFKASVARIPWLTGNFTGFISGLLHENRLYRFTEYGGDLYTYTFHGMEEYAGLNDTLVCTGNPYETSTEIRERRTNLLKAGMIRFASMTPLISEIDITHGEAIEQEEVIDRWRNWVFEISTSPEYTAEESYKRLDIRNSLSVTRITPDIKLKIDFDQSYTRQRFIEEDLDTTYLRSFERLENLFLKSLGDHWNPRFGN